MCAQYDEQNKQYTQSIVKNFQNNDSVSEPSG